MSLNYKHNRARNLKPLIVEVATTKASSGNQNWESWVHHKSISINQSYKNQLSTINNQLVSGRQLNKTHQGFFSAKNSSDLGQTFQSDHTYTNGATLNRISGSSAMHVKSIKDKPA